MYAYYQARLSGVIMWTLARRTAVRILSSRPSSRGTSISLASAKPSPVFFQSRFVNDDLELFEAGRTNGLPPKLVEERKKGQVGRNGGPSSDALSPPQSWLLQVFVLHTSIFGQISMGYDLVGNCQIFFLTTAHPCVRLPNFQSGMGRIDEEDIQEGRRVSTVASDPWRFFCCQEKACPLLRHHPQEDGRGTFWRLIGPLLIRG